MTFPTRSVAVVLAAAIVGCGSKPTGPSPGTGSREAAAAFFEAIVRSDWQAAYDGLDPSGRGTAEPFAKRAEAYRRRLGFEPTAVHVRACDENGDEATAHVELTGHGGGRHTYKDAVKLRRTPEGWRVVLLAGFGR